MFGPFERAVAGRYLRARKGERFVSVIAIFSLVGIALGVATLIVVTSVMSGFKTELLSRILGFNGHITIEVYRRRQDRRLPRRCRPYPQNPGHRLGHSGARRPGAADHRQGRCARRVGARHHARPICDRCTRSATISWPARWTISTATMRSRSASACATVLPLRIGIRLTLISPQGAATAFGTMPRVRAYKVVAVFDAGLNEYNNT